MLNKELVQIIRDLRLTGPDGRVAIRSGYSIAWNEVMETLNNPTAYGISKAIYENISELNEDNERYEEASAELVDIISKSLGRTIAIAREDAIPLIKNMTDSVKTRVDAAMEANASEDITLDIFKIPAIVLDSDGLIDVDPYMDAPSFKSNTTIPSLDIDNLYERMSEMLSTRPTSLSQWMSNVGEEDFMEYAANILKGTSLSRDVSSRLDTFLSAKMDRAITGVLVAKAFTDNIPENVNISLSEYRSTLTGKIKQYSAEIAVLVKKANRFQESKRVIIAEDKTSKVLEVYGPLHDEWLDTTGSIEALYGRLLSDDKTYMLTGLQNKVLEYAQIWRKYNGLVMANRLKQRNNILKNAYLDNFDMLIDELTPTEKEFISENMTKSEYKAKSRKIAEHIVNTAKPTEIVRVSTMVTTMIASARFGHTSVPEFLESMAHASENIDNEDPAVLASVAVIDIVADYIKSATIFNNK